MDMVFVVRLLAEKAVEHHTKQFFVFVDLHKAYDSVPPQAMHVRAVGSKINMVQLIWHALRMGEIVVPN